VLERGAIVQSRGVIEHLGLWRSGENHLLTQLSAIPFHQLPMATQRIEAVLNEAGRPALPRAENYRKALAGLL